jgi:cytoskeletal protein CcmA (bactofilin family)
MADYIEIQNRDYCFIGKKTHLTGEFRFYGITHVYGKLEGNIEMQQESELSIRPDGVVLGAITCHNIDIHGTVEGIIRSTGKVTIFSGAQVYGEINSAQLVIHPGATLDTDAHTLS